MGRMRYLKIRQAVCVFALAYICSLVLLGGDASAATASPNPRQLLAAATCVDGDTEGLKFALWGNDDLSDPYKIGASDIRVAWNEDISDRMLTIYLRSSIYNCNNKSNILKPGTKIYRTVQWPDVGVETTSGTGHTDVAFVLPLGSLSFSSGGVPTNIGEFSAPEGYVAVNVSYEDLGIPKAFNDSPNDIEGSFGVSYNGRICVTTEKAVGLDDNLKGECVRVPVNWKRLKNPDWVGEETVTSCNIYPMNPDGDTNHASVNGSPPRGNDSTTFSGYTIPVYTSIKTATFSFRPYLSSSNSCMNNGFNFVDEMLVNSTRETGVPWQYKVDMTVFSGSGNISSNFASNATTVVPLTWTDRVNTTNRLNNSGNYFIPNSSYDTGGVLRTYANNGVMSFTYDNTDGSGNEKPGDIIICYRLTMYNYDLHLDYYTNTPNRVAGYRNYGTSYTGKTVSQYTAAVGSNPYYRYGGNSTSQIKCVEKRTGTVPRWVISPNAYIKKSSGGSWSTNPQYVYSDEEDKTVSFQVKIQNISIDDMNTNATLVVKTYVVRNGTTTLEQVGEEKQIPVRVGAGLTETYNTGSFTFGDGYAEGDRVFQRYTITINTLGGSTTFDSPSAYYFNRWNLIPTIRVEICPPAGVSEPCTKSSITDQVLTTRPSAMNLNAGVPSGGAYRTVSVRGEGWTAKFYGGVRVAEGGTDVSTGRTILFAAHHSYGGAAYGTSTPADRNSSYTYSYGYKYGLVLSSTYFPHDSYYYYSYSYPSLAYNTPSSYYTSSSALSYTNASTTVSNALRAGEQLLFTVPYPASNEPFDRKFCAYSQLSEAYFTTGNNTGTRYSGMICAVVHDVDSTGAAGLNDKWLLEPESTVSRDGVSYTSTVNVTPLDTIHFKHTLSVQVSSMHEQDANWRLQERALRESSYNDLSGDYMYGGGKANLGEYLANTTHVRNGVITPADAGERLCERISFAPSSAFDDSMGYSTGACAQVPYNYKLQPVVELKDGVDYVDRGELVEVEKFINVLPKEKLDKLYATKSLPTQWRLSSFSIPGGKTSADVRTDLGDSPGELCNGGSGAMQSWISNCTELISDHSQYNGNLNDQTAGHVFTPRFSSGDVSGSKEHHTDDPAKLVTTASLKVPDSLGLGESFCAILSVRYENEGNSWNGGTRSGRWVYSKPVCVVVGVKPLVGVKGGGVYANGDMRTVVVKKNVSGYDRYYGSWVEYEAIASRGSIKDLASGAYLSGTGSGGRRVTEMEGIPEGYSKLSIANNRNDGNLGKAGLDGVPANTDIATALSAKLSKMAGMSTVSDCSSIGKDGDGVSALGNMLKVRLSSGGNSSGCHRKISSDLRISVPTGASGVVLSASDNSGNSSGTSGTIEIPEGRTVFIDAKDKIVKINSNIEYKNVSYSTKSLPQVVIIAKDIRIDEKVTRVDAWLIASGTVYTCDFSAACKRPSNSADTLPFVWSHDPVSGSGSVNIHCEKKLEINGPVWAGDLKMHRVHGVVGSSYTPGTLAEQFFLRPDAYLWAYNKSKSSDTLVSTYEVQPAVRY